MKLLWLLKSKKKSYDKLEEVSRKEAEVSKETYIITNLENNNEIDRLKKALEQKTVEVKKGLRDNNNKRKLKANAKEMENEYQNDKFFIVITQSKLAQRRFLCQSGEANMACITLLKKYSFYNCFALFCAHHTL